MNCYYSFFLISLMIFYCRQSKFMNTTNLCTNVATMNFCQQHQTKWKNSVLKRIFLLLRSVIPISNSCVVLLSACSAHEGFSYSFIKPNSIAKNLTQHRHCHMLFLNELWYPTNLNTVHCNFYCSLCEKIQVHSCALSKIINNQYIQGRIPISPMVASLVKSGFPMNKLFDKAHECT